VSAATNDTVYLNNTTTGLVVGSNVEVGGNLSVEGDVDFNGNLTMNTITVQTLFTLDHVVSQGNTTSNTVQFTNPTTALTATGNVEVGGELSVSGDVELSSNLMVSGDATVSGNVGVGVTNLTTRFAILDEAHESEELPPKAMTDYETHMEGHGVFRAYASTDYGVTPYRSWNAFDKTITTVGGNNGWASSEWTWINDGSTTPDTSNAVVFDGVQCHWLALELPYAINPGKVTLQARNDNNVPTEVPKIGRIYGSNDRNTWTKLKDYDITSEVSVLNTSADNEPIDINLTTNEYYKHLLLTVDERYGGNQGTPRWTSIGELRYFGTRERGQSTLHDGELKLTKNLTVPRIGPPLDTDDTPRRDRLVVEYNTSTNPTDNETVRDTSGRGLDGSMVGASYDATEKALNFTASTGGSGAAVDSSDSVKTNYDWGTSTPAHSHSVWFKRTVDLSDYEWVCGIGTASTGQQSAILISGNSSYPNRITFDCFNDWIYSDITAELNTWYHVVAVYTGDSSTWNTTNCRIYVNGVLRSSTAASSSTFNLTGNYVTLAATHDGKRGITGFISNYKLYDVALTAEEVKRLYYMGRCDEGHHDVNFSKTRVGIGLGDGQAPRGVLDVRGSALFAGNVGLGTLSPESGMHYKQASDQSYLSATLGSYQNGAIFERYGTTNRWTFAHDDAGSMCFFFDATRKGYLLSGGSDGRVNFTGQHRTFIKDIPFTQAEELEGLIVSADNNKYIKMSGGIEAGSNAITTNESLPVVSLSTIVNDKKCFGVISASEDPETRQEVHGNFVSDQEKELGDTRVYINSVGEGAIWVVNTNGSLESGDYITTSNVTGYGQKQDSESLKNYTVAKITMDCDFDPATQPLQVIKKDEDGVNVLDEHGQLQWEDHPTETEKTYKIRYLDATGVQTDEANAVHIAAFVGCTYHCG